MANLGKAAERYQVEWVAVDALDPATYNPREPMTDDELDRLGLSIRSHGFVEPIVADKRKWEKGRKRPVVVGGHQRLAACKRMELSDVPVVFSDCASLKDEQALNVRLNRLVGRWDAEKLVPILESFEAAEWPSLGFEEWEVAEFKELARPILEQFQPGEGLSDEDYQQIAFTVHKDKTAIIEEALLRVMQSKPANMLEKGEALVRMSEQIRQANPP